MSELSRLKVEETAEGVFRLGTGYVGFYVLEEGGKFTLVDSGVPGYWDQLVQFLAGRGAKVSDIEAQVLTHHHVDHRGNTRRLAEETDAKAHIHVTDAPYVSVKPPPPKAPLWKPSVFRYFTHLLRNGIMRVKPVLQVSTFTDGETLDLPGRPRVVHVPGHTMGNCSLYLEDKRTIVAGDSLAGMDLITGEIGPRIAPSFVNEDNELALESLSRLEELDAERVLVVHGPNFRGSIQEAVRLAREAGF